MLIKPRRSLIVSRRALIKGVGVSLGAPAILTLLSKEARAAFSLVAHVAALGDNVTSSSINTTGANLLVAVASGFHNGSQLTPTLSDSKSNTWVQIGTTQQSGAATNIQTAIYYVATPTVGTGHTFTVGNLGIAESICVAAFSGASSTPLDGTNHTQATASQAGSVTPSAANALVIAAAGPPDSNSTTSASGYTTTDNANYTAGTCEGSGLAYLIQTSATATNPTWSWSPGTGNPNAFLASFLSSGGGAAPKPSNLPAMGAG